VLTQPAWRSAAWLLVVLVQACAARPQTSTISAPRSSSDTRYVEVEPLPYTPEATQAMQVGDSRGATISAPYEQLRNLGRALLQALVDNDVARLQDLFSERVIFVLEGTSKPRAELIDGCLKETRSISYGVSVQPAALADLRAIEVSRADALYAQTGMPRGIRNDDLVIRFHAPPAQVETARRITCLATLFVRPGASPSIVGIAR